jgi:cytoskeleton protein RodZ
MIEELCDTQQIQAGTTITIGELLRSKREEKGLNLKNMSFQTKIHIGMLANLENNELSKLPNKVYVRGFVSAAAKILGINQAEALEILESTYNPDYKVIIKEEPILEIQPDIKQDNILSFKTSKIQDSKKSITEFLNTSLAKGLIGVFIVGTIALSGVLSPNHHERNSIPKAVMPKVTIAIPKPSMPVLAQPRPEPIKISEKTEITIKDVSFKSFTRTLKQFTIDDSVSEDELDEIFPSRYKVSLVKGIDNVFINAVEGDSWITYKVDDKEIQKYVLREGRKVFISGANIRLLVKNSSALKIFYNNKLISLTDKRSVKNLVFPEVVKTQFMYPLFVFQKDGTVMTSDEYISASQKEQQVTSSSSTPPQKTL